MVATEWVAATGSKESPDGKELGPLTEAQLRVTLVKVPLMDCVSAKERRSGFQRHS